jgi:hypothetical protein
MTGVVLAITLVIAWLAWFKKRDSAMIETSKST